MPAAISLMSNAGESPARGGQPQGERGHCLGLAWHHITRALEESDPALLLLRHTIMMTGVGDRRGVANCAVYHESGLNELGSVATRYHERQEASRSLRQIERDQRGRKVARARQIGSPTGGLIGGRFDSNKMSALLRVVRRNYRLSCESDLFDASIVLSEA